MTRKINRYKYFLFLLSILQPFWALASGNAKQLFDIHYTMPGQEALLMYYAASLPEQPGGNDLVLLGESAETGFGIYAYHFRFGEIVSPYTTLPVKRAMYDFFGSFGA